MAELAGSISMGRVELLNGTNYYIWQLKVSAILRSKRLFKAIIENEEPEISNDPTSVEFKERTAWEEKNDDAFGIIILTLSPEQAGMFIGETNAKKVWNELKKIHAGNLEDRRIDVMLELKNIRMGNDNVGEYITRARNISTKCASLGQPISERELVYYIVRGVNPKLEGAAAVLRPQRSATLEEVQQALKEEENRINDGKPYINKFENAYKAKSNGKLPFRNNLKCYNCGKIGHIAKACWDRKENAHVRDKGKQNKMAETARFKNGNINKKDQRYERAEMVSTDYAFNINDDIFKKSEYKNCEEWNLDSGCTSHMTSNNEWLYEREKIFTKISIAEEGRFLKANVKGKVKICAITSEGKENNICINNVLYVPRLKTNLLSIRCLVNKGYKIIFENNKAKIYDNKNDLIAEANEKNRMYMLQVKQGSEYTNENKCLTTNTSDELSQKQTIWHRRLGHLNEKYILDLKRHNLVHDFDYNKGKLNFCEPCVMGKISQTPFKSVEEDTTNEPLQLVHMDICGPMPCLSIGGSKYLYVLVDSYTRRYFTYFLKTKNEAFEKFIEFKNRRENEKNVKIKAIRSDNGLEFVNNEFEKYLIKEGIKGQRTTTYASSSNGIAERANRSLLDKARTLLIDSQLPVEFWAEAIATAAYQKNCTVVTKKREKLPMELWTGKKPKVNHMKVFGCVAYYYISKKLRNKLESKAKKGIFVGYSVNRIAYRIYDPIDGKIHEARSVKFNEKERGADLLIKENYTNVDMKDLVYNDLEVELNDRLMIENQQQENKEQREPDNDRNESKKTGRRKGETSEVIKGRHEENIRQNEEKLIEQGVRRSERLADKKQVNVRSEEVNVITEDINVTDIKWIPKKFEDIKGTIYQTEWEKAMDVEKQSLDLHKVWELVPREKSMKVIKSKWVYNIKENPDGTINKRKARLVAMGYNQRSGIDYEDSFSPVVKIESFRTLMAIVSQLNLEYKQYDVKTAYLNGDLTETLFMEQPKGYIQEGSENKVCKLIKSIYGLPQSGRNWNEKLNCILKGCKLKRLESDPCMYIKREKGELYILGVYVDDIIIAGTNMAGIEKISKEIRKSFDLIDRSGEMFIGIEIKQTSDGIELSQKTFVDKILDKFGLEDCNSVKYPMDMRQDLDNHEDSTLIEQSIFQEMIGSLVYLSNGTRPDIAHSVSRLSQYIKNPKQMHLTAVKRIYRYLKGTKDYIIKYSRRKGNISVSTDSSWSSTADSKSFGGYIVKLGESLVSWKCKKQNLVTLSTCEAEMIAISEGVREIKWMTGLLSELELEEYIKLPVVINTHILGLL